MKHLTSIDPRQELIADYSKLVYRIACQFKNDLPSSMEVADLVQVGLIGLLEASDSYDPHIGAQFTTFAAIRIRGAMLDELRRQTRSPRWLRRFERALSNTQREIENEQGRAARQSEIAARAGVSPAALANIALQVKSDFPQDVENYDVESEDTECDPFSNLADEQFRLALVVAIMRLSHREQSIMQLYYQNEWTLEQIAKHHEVSESRVCQLKQQAIGTLRRLLAERYGVNHGPMDGQRRSLGLAESV